MRVPLFLVFSFTISTSHGQVDTSYVSATSDMKELLRLSSLKSKDESTTVATQVEVPIREVPSIVSVLTEDDIVRSGARDLRELLSLLPGLDFATDVQNITGMGVRGLWGLEGKVLVLLDGNTMNETSYGAFSFSQHIFLGNIKRIEVIRGPGSAIYGGIGALCVINITSKNYSESTTQGRISQSFGLSQNQLSRKLMQFGFGKRWDNGFAISTTGTISQANLSNRILADTLSYADSSTVNTNQFGVQASYKMLSVAMLYDGHKVDYVEGPGRSVFNGWYAQINYQWRISEKLTLLPTVKLKIQQPWNLENVGGQDGSISSTTNHRNLAGARLLYEPNERFSLASGIEYYIDDAIFDNVTQSFSNGDRIINFNNLALYAQGIYKTKWFNITGGFRVDDHNYFGTAFVPRLGITHAGKHWHAKLLYTNAFKAPTIVNLDVNSDIRPERLSSGELEMGFQPREGITITGNFFYTEVKNPILYYSLTGLSSEYRNGEQVGSAGFEFSGTIKKGWGRLHANYSFYQTANSKEPYFEVPNESSLLGFPQHKIAAQAFVILSENVSTTLTALLQGSKYYVDSEKNIERIKPIASLNALFTHTHFLYPSLTLTVGVYNIFDQTQWLVQPYNWAAQRAGNINPTSGMGREFGLSIHIQIKP
jgi:outer membrane receptor for ferrienterochelin and colicin